MDITNFTESNIEKSIYEYRMLIYGNYTNRSNLEADSFVIVLKNIILYLNQHYKIHFTILVPQLINSLSFDNVDQVIYDLPTYPNTMRTHFDAIRFLEIINWKEKDFDIVYSHLPEHTEQIANCFYNNTNIHPKIIGYCHWFEVPQNTNYVKTMLPANLHGILQMEECGVNSMWLKKLVLKEAEKYLSPKLLVDLDRIIQPHYLGVDSVDTDDRWRATEPIHNAIIFNHRDDDYTGWNWFVDIIDKIWKTRQDFTVWTTQAWIDRKWNKKMNIPTRTEYLKFLQRMTFGVGCFKKYSAWSISVTDGLSVGVPYILPNDFCYPEMLPSNYPSFYNNESEFIQKFNELLDSKLFMMNYQLHDDFLWDNRISKWFNEWKNVFTFEENRDDTDSYREIVRLIAQYKYLTKKQLLDKLGWGVRVIWTPYRTSLRKHPNIQFTKNGYQWND